MRQSQYVPGFAFVLKRRRFGEGFDLVDQRFIGVALRLEQMVKRDVDGILVAAFEQMCDQLAKLRLPIVILGEAARGAEAKSKGNQSFGVRREPGNGFGA